jgi:glycosyltransferase involved in cell wall biosynthesis
LSHRSHQRARIVFLLPSFDIGGAERVVLRTAAGLDPARYDPFVVAFVEGGGRLRSELTAARIGHHALKTGTGASPALLWRLLRWLRKHPCDVLMTYMFHANVAGRLVRRLAHVPALVCSERGLWEETPLRVALNRLTASLATVITTNSQQGVCVWARRLKLPTSEIRLIYNGIDPALFQVTTGTSSGEVIIGNLARLHPFKGHETLIDALVQLDARRDLPAWRCVVAGRGRSATACWRGETPPGSNGGSNSSATRRRPRRSSSRSICSSTCPTRKACRTRSSRRWRAGCPWSRPPSAARRKWSKKA